jgi:hypothetical protein
MPNLIAIAPVRATARSKKPGECTPCGEPAPFIRASTTSDERAQVEQQLSLVQGCLNHLSVRFDILAAGFTGEFPIASTEPSYDLTGLEREEGFSISYAEAVVLGRRLQSEISSDFSEEDRAF